MPPDHAHTLLVVEDRADVREGMVALLESKGHRAVSAGSGHDALVDLRDGVRPCVIVLDLALPDMPGAAFRDAQRADPRIAAIPVIVVSGADEAKEAEAQLGVHAFLHKPIDVEAFLRAVDECCRRAEASTGAAK